MSVPVQEQRSVPTVMIVGAGLGGLLLAILFERANIPYHIYERATVLRPLGSAMTMGADILPVFEQLGLLEELKQISRPLSSLDLYNKDMKFLGQINLKTRKAVIIFARPKFHELLLRQVPAHKISLGKKVLSSEESDGRIIINCSDNTKYEGEILVGADGAYSGVRQSLYKRMAETDMLPKVDQEGFSIGYVSMVGVTSPQDPEKYPILKDSYAHFSQVLGDDNCSWGVQSVANNQICWILSTQLSPSDAKEQQFRNSEWGPEANEAMIRKYRDFLCPWGGTMGDIFDATVDSLTSKVFLEEKAFKTWYHSRTVLLGDGAVNAMQDAVVLANCLFNIPDNSMKNITVALQGYYRQRYPRSFMQFRRSNGMSKILAGQTWMERALRYVLLNYIPDWVQQRSFAKTLEYRPQIAWLPLVETRGSGHVVPQECARRVIEQQQPPQAV
ncbi:hypothetical protein BGZ54_001869 [Gamsiella multidivaricata]|nr:hypothetical protein BGZ54_001869 [Gamsiella multidivaricata]